MNSQVKVVKIRGIKLLGKSSPYANLTAEEQFLCNNLGIHPKSSSVYGRMQIGGWNYCTEDVANKCSTDNSKVWFKTTQQVATVIKKLLHDENSGKVWVVYSVVRCTPYQYPQQARNLKLNNCHLLDINSIDGDLSFQDACSLHGFFVNLDLDYGHYLSPIPNCYNIF